MRLLSLRVQQTALFVAVILVAVLVMSTWLISELTSQVTEVTRSQQVKDSSAVALVLGPYFPVSAENLGELRDRVRQFADVLDDDVRIYDTAGTLVEGHASLEVPPAVLAEVRRRGMDDAGFAVVDLSSGGLVVAGSPIYDRAGGKVGVAVVSNSAASAHAMLDTSRAQLEVAAVVTILLAGLLGFVFSDIIARQTGRLIEAANDIAAGDFSRRMPRNLLPDEIRTLVEAFNRMAEQLGEAFDTLTGQEAAQREFVANASHEMRTPIAALKGAIEILEEGAKDKPEARDEFLATMRVEINRLQRLVDNLFTLAQVDSGRLHLMLRPEPVDEIVRIVVSSMRPLANEAGVAIQAEVPGGDVTAACDRDYITQVLIGFTDNAIKHSQPGGIVTVSVEPKDGLVRFCVCDTGGGIPPEVLPHIFDRFYTQRKSAEGKRRGSGLGLAIAYEIVEAHGSRIEVRSSAEEGTRFCFSLERGSGSA